MTSLATLLFLVTATSSVQDTTWVFPEVIALPPEEVVIYIDFEETTDAELSKKNQEILTSKVDTKNLDNENTMYSGEMQEEQLANRWVEEQAAKGADLAIVMGVLGGVLLAVASLLCILFLKPMKKHNPAACLEVVEEWGRLEVEQLVEEGRRERRRLEEEVRRSREEEGGRRNEGFISAEVYV